MLFSSPLGRAKKIICATMKKNSLFEGCLIDSYKEKDTVTLYTLRDEGLIEDAKASVYILYNKEKQLSASILIPFVRDEGDLRYQVLKEVAESVDDEEYTVSFGHGCHSCLEGTLVLLTAKEPVQEEDLAITTTFLLSEVSSVLENYLVALVEEMDELEGEDEDDYEDEEEEE
ncbi:MAG: hypothetical protein J6W28_04715 [Clostridia bacterium]|nr:hypothetical protein [Clostridia bacterium]